MTEPVPIGPNRCMWCGGEYGDHHPDCRTLEKPKQEAFVFEVGDRVQKVGGDYKFVGWVAGLIRKRSGAARYAVENADGVLFIHKAENLRYENETLAT